MPHASVNGSALLAEVRGGETTDNARLGELSMPALVVTADGSPEPIRQGSEALANAMPQARARGRRSCDRPGRPGGHGVHRRGSDSGSYVDSSE